MWLCTTLKKKVKLLNIVLQINIEDAFSTLRFCTHFAAAPVINLNHSDFYDSVSS